MNSKLHAVCDEAGRPILLHLTAGQVSDHKGARELLPWLPKAAALLGDRGYDSNWFRNALADQGTVPCIPPTKCRKQAIDYDKTLYRQRHKIENMFAKLKDWRRILAWLERRGGTIDDFVFPSRIDHADHVSTRQYARLVDEWVTGIGLHREDYGTHSLRRTKASIIYKQTGNLRAVKILLGHTKIESTVRYLGVDIEDALALAEGTEV